MGIIGKAITFVIVRIITSIIQVLLSKMGIAIPTVTFHLRIVIDIKNN